MKTFLITGVAGNIGSSLAKFLIKSKTNIVIGVDNLETGNLRNLPQGKNFYFHQIDVNKKKSILKIFEIYPIQYIYHYAAFVGVDRTLQNPEKCFDDLKGVENIIYLSQKFGIKKIAFASSSEVYGENAKIPYSEDRSPTNPKLPYATVKLAAENMIASLCEKYTINYIIFRFFNTYGPNQSDDYVIKKFINAAINNRDIEIFGSGKQTRTFLFIDDNIKGTVKAFETNNLNHTIINIGSKKMYSIKELALLIIKLTKSKSKIKYLPRREKGDTKIRQPENKIFLQLIKDKKLISLNEGLLKVIKAS